MNPDTWRTAALLELRAAMARIPRQQHAALCLCIVDHWWSPGFPDGLHEQHITFRQEAGLLPYAD